MTTRYLISLACAGAITAGCSVSFDEAEGTEVVSQGEAIHRGLTIGDPANDDPQDLEAAVHLTYYGRWDGIGNTKDASRKLGGGCTGVVIANDAIVTAGHCLDNRVEASDGKTIVTTYGLWPGESAWFWVDVKARQREEGGSDSWHSGWYIATLHPDYDFDAFGVSDEKDDIVILVAQNKAALLGIDYAEIWTAPIYTGMRLDMYGWGPNSDTGDGFGILRKGHDNSQLRVDSFNSRSLKGSSTDARTCKGDSGGPLLRWVLYDEPVIGIASNATLSDQCTRKNDNAQRYTRLAPKLNWIQAKLGRSCSSWGDFVRCY